MLHFLSITADKTGFRLESPEDLPMVASGNTPDDVLAQLPDIFAKGVKAGVFSADAILTVRTPDGQDVELCLPAGP